MAARRQALIENSQCESYSQPVESSLVAHDNGTASALKASQQTMCQHAVNAGTIGVNGTSPIPVYNFISANSMPAPCVCRIDAFAGTTESALSGHKAGVAPAPTSPAAEFKGPYPSATSTTTDAERAATSIQITNCSPVSQAGTFSETMDHEPSKTCNTLRISRPAPNDVLFGRGKTHKRHPGNRRMQLLADIHRDVYNESQREEKTEITYDIIRIIKSTGGRFLKHDKLRDEWVEVNLKTSREKVSHAMRDGRTKPLHPINLREVDRLPLISNRVRADAVRMSSLFYQGAQNAFGKEEAEILQSLLQEGPSNDTSRE